MLMKLILLCLGGAAGTLARYGLDGAAHRTIGQGFPYGTMVVNLLGCFLLGFFVSVYNGPFALDHRFKFFFMVGFCGAFTTFSTFILQTAELVEEKMLMLAALNVGISLLAGLVLFVVGLKLGKLL